MVARSSIGFVLAAVTLVLAGCASTTERAKVPVLTPAWTLGGLASPESLLWSAEGEFLYVSNVGGEGDARDGNGFIACISADGRLLQREWASGLNAPKGMARLGETLYVSDIDHLVAIDAGSGRILARHPIEGAKFLNDVAVAEDGTVLVSDSGTGRIHAWRDGAMSLWLEDPLLASINGLLPEQGQLLVTTMRGRLLAINPQTRAITVLAEGLGDADGVARLGDGSLLVSEWPGRLFHVRADGSVQTLLDTRADKVYLNDFLLRDDLLLIPNWEPGQVSAWRLRWQ